MVWQPEVPGGFQLGGTGAVGTGMDALRRRWLIWSRFVVYGQTYKLVKYLAHANQFIAAFAIWEWTYPYLLGRVVFTPLYCQAAEHVLLICLGKHRSDVSAISERHRS